MRQVSQNPGALVTHRSYLPPPERCEPMAALVARDGGSIQPRSPATTVEYALPTEASSEVRAFWAAETAAEIGPTFHARLPGGRVFGEGIVLSPDGRSLARDVSPDFGKPFGEHWLLTYRKISPPRPLPGETTVIATALGAGYGHWLLDELPRLLALPRHATGTLLAHASQPFSRAALALRGWSGPVIDAEREAHFACEELVVPSLEGTVVTPTRAALALLADFTPPLLTPDRFLGERVYLSREGARRRRVLNEGELWATLQPAGFVKVRLEDLTWPQQINAFRHAKVIVAPHGAGLANLAFCAPGTRVIELFNRSYVHGCFWRLAALQGLDYRPIVPTGPDPLSQASAHNRLDLVADVAQVRAALR